LIQFVCAQTTLAQHPHPFTGGELPLPLYIENKFSGRKNKFKVIAEVYFL